MSDLYDTDAVTWAEQQASLFRRIAAGERVNGGLARVRQFWPAEGRRAIYGPSRQ